MAGRDRYSTRAGFVASATLAQSPSEVLDPLTRTSDRQLLISRIAGEVPSYYPVFRVSALIRHVDAAVLARLIYASTLWCSGFLADFMRGAHMRNFFEAARVKEVKERMALLRPDSERLWGTMNAPQAVAHCSAGLELALGDKTPPRVLVGRIFGWIVKPLALRNDEPMRRNSPTVKGLVVQDERDLGTERDRLLGLIDRFAACNPRPNLLCTLRGRFAA
jgi:hypothetical protein